MSFFTRLDLWIRRYGWRVVLILMIITALIRAWHMLGLTPR